MEKKKEVIVLAIISLIIGILALLLSWIPIINNLAALLAVIGFILGVIAVIINRKNKKTISVVGLVISIVAFTIVIFTQVYYAKAIKDSDKKTYLSSSSISSSSNHHSKASSNKKVDDFSKVPKTYTLTSGNYEVGTDIPAGVANITAISGKGNLTTDSGSINEMFGIDDGDGLYTGSYKNAELKEGDILKLNSDMKISLNYTKVESNIHPWTYNENAARQLSTGTYTAGIDFPAGIYKIVAVSGTGNLSDEYDLNESFGIDDGDKIYNSQFNGANLTDGDKLEVSGNLVIKLVPVNK